MPHTRFTNQEIVQRGEEMYHQTIRSLVETEQNLGQIIVIDIETGDYEVAESGLLATQRAKAKHPDAALLGLRIGFDVVEGFGGFGPRRVKR